MKAMVQWRTLGSLLSLVGLAGCAAAPGPSDFSTAPSARYVAMGSFFAAGPGVTVSADSPATRCTRSRDNYAHQLARLRHLDLVDVSCGGATTAHLLGSWKELAPQLDALTPDTALATITIGGNDVSYVGYLFAEECKGTEGRTDLTKAAAMCKAMAAQQSSGSVPTAPTDAAWAKLADDMDRIAVEVRRRAPRARLIFVDYVTLVRSRALCP
ncbi:GDSL-type esterase/lipase family protein [Sphingobium sp. Z007]|uniref:GDSL-type esterase/lipase family protein n=1 Tax=Sphingobium sp. Z007 TaxID=627495 RepID=UPI000B4A458B|nr:GDSL-type esterase/lipase family protein [Sphingobium sp. Z007]